MRRRQFIAAASAAASAAALSTAGCLRPSDSPSRPRARLHAVWFVNDSDDACDVTVTVTDDDDGETVYETSFQLGAAGGDGPSSNVSRDPSVSDPGAYVVRATVADDTATIDTTKWASSGENCVTAKFVRTTRGTLRARPQAYENC